MAVAPQLPYPHISKDPRICSGRACVSGTRVRVMDVVSLHQTGATPDEIVRELPTLHGVADVYAALLYFEDHRDEIEADFAEQQQTFERLERERLTASSRR